MSTDLKQTAVEAKEVVVLTCALCYCDFSQNKVHYECPNSEEHTVCEQCFGDYVAHCCDEYGMGKFPIVCVHPDCDCEVPNASIHSLLQTETNAARGLWDRYLDSQLKAGLSVDRDNIPFTCARCESYTFLLPSNYRARATTFQRNEENDLLEAEIRNNESLAIKRRIVEMNAAREKRRTEHEKKYNAITANHHIRWERADAGDEDDDDEILILDLFYISDDDEENGLGAALQEMQDEYEKRQAAREAEEKLPEVLEKKRIIRETREKALTDDRKECKTKFETKEQVLRASEDAALLAYKNKIKTDREERLAKAQELKRKAEAEKKEKKNNLAGSKSQQQISQRELRRMQRAALLDMNSIRYPPTCKSKRARQRFRRKLRKEAEKLQQEEEYELMKEIDTYEPAQPNDDEKLLSPPTLIRQVSDGALTSLFVACGSDDCGASFCLRCDQTLDTDETQFHVCGLDRMLELYIAFEEVLVKASSRTCPKCNFAGQKDLACTHMSCQCGVTWCYQCETVPKSMGDHNAWTALVPDSDKKCPMYLRYRYSAKSLNNNNTWQGNNLQEALDRYHIRVKRQAVADFKQSLDAQDQETFEDMMEYKYPDGIWDRQQEKVLDALLAWEQKLQEHAELKKQAEAKQEAQENKQTELLMRLDIADLDRKIHLKEVEIQQAKCDKEDPLLHIKTLLDYREQMTQLEDELTQRLEAGKV